MRVLFVTFEPFNQATTRYRCLHLAQALRRRGALVDLAWVGQRQIRVAHDVVVLHRIGLKREGRRLAEAARACGATLVYGTDDLTFEPEFAFHAGAAYVDDPVVYQRHRANLDANIAMVRAADAVLTSTEFLAERARLLTDKPVHVVRNALSEEMLHAAAGAAARRFVDHNDRVTLGYLSGSSTHDADLGDISDPLGRVLDRFENANLLLVGNVRLPPVLERFAGRIQRHPFVDWRDLPDLQARVDINLAPLDPTRLFNHAKSEIKFLEAAAVCVPTIASATAGFREAVSHEENGLLALKRTDWDPLLSRLIVEPDTRAVLAANARAALCERGTVLASSEQTADVFAQLAGQTTPEQARRRSARVFQPFSTRAAVLGAESWCLRRWVLIQSRWRHALAEQQRKG